MRRLFPLLVAPVMMGCVASRPAQVAHPAILTANGVNAVPRPGDVVRLKIWREPDLSGDFTVAKNCVVVFPKIGALDVTHIPVDSLSRQLTARYSASLRDPAVEVTILRRISVLGAVRTPGFYYADPTVTINGALALAGGVTTAGNQHRIELLRDGQRRSINADDVHSLADSTVLSGDDIRVPERSWLSRNTGLVASGITAAALIFAAVIRP